MYFFFCPWGYSNWGSCFENKVTVKCIKSEREALVRFKEGVIDFPGKLSSWVGGDCCKWKGVECDSKSGHVTNLSISNPAGRHRHFDYYEGIQYRPVRELCFERSPYDRCPRSLLGKITSSLIHLKYLKKLFEFLNVLAC